MSVLFYFSCILLLESSAEILPDVQAVPLRATEHRINIRSTPSLDPVEELFEKFGSEDRMNLTQVAELLKSVGISEWNNTGQRGTHKNGEQSCFSTRHFYGMYSKDDGTVNRTDFIDLCPAVLYQLSKKECKVSGKEEVKEEESEGKEDPSKAWGFGFLFVTIINFGCLIGAFVVPFMDKPFYKKILLFMVSLAVGVLGGSGVFHLIPSALGFAHEDGDHSYLWKCAMIVSGLYLFFILESGMKLYIRFKTIKNEADSNIASEPEEKQKDVTNGVSLMKFSSTTGHGHSHGGPDIVHGPVLHFGGVENENVGLEAHTNVGSVVTRKPEKKVIATVAWMIILGDGLHNFIDGLAIGASFSSSAVVGISTSLAVISEELPHELGDFAILLNSGFSYKQAMVANFLSACTCYIGLVIGLLLGYATSAVKYIYGIAGGMFLYISLVDMLPEAVEMAYSLSGNSKSKTIRMMFLQNLAMVIGFVVMFILALYGGSIQV